MQSNAYNVANRRTNEEINCGFNIEYIRIKLIDKKHQAILEENIKLHKSEAYFYEIQHPGIYNVLEQWRIRKELTEVKNGFAIKNIVCLDVGSGTGNLIPHLTSMGFEVIACDLSIAMLKQNGSEHKVLCEAGGLPFRKGICNLIVTYSVFHHLPTPYKTLAEFCRVCSIPSVLYFDHDSFITERDWSKRDKVLQFFSYTLWLLTKPRFLKRLLQYILWGRKKHLRYLQTVNFQLTEHNPLNVKITRQILSNSGFKVRVVGYKNGSLLKAVRSV